MSGKPRPRRLPPAPLSAGPALPVPTGEHGPGGRGSEASPPIAVSRPLPPLPSGGRAELPGRGAHEGSGCRGQPGGAAPSRLGAEIRKARSRASPGAGPVPLGLPPAMTARRGCPFGTVCPSPKGQAPADETSFSIDALPLQRGRTGGLRVLLLLQGGGRTVGATPRRCAPAPTGAAPGGEGCASSEPLPEARCTGKWGKLRLPRAERSPGAAATPPRVGGQPHRRAALPTAPLGVPDTSKAAGQCRGVNSGSPSPSLPSTPGSAKR